MKFISKYKEYTISLIPPRYVVDNTGQRNFVPGIVVEFHNFEYNTEDQKIIEMLKQSEWYNVDFKAVGDVEPASEAAQNKIKEEKESAENTLTSCPFCTFNAKTRIGLESHIKFKHPENAGSQNG
jgi:hypothetical protein